MNKQTGKTGRQTRKNQAELFRLSHSWTFAVRFLPENPSPSRSPSVFWGPFETKILPKTQTGAMVMLSLTADLLDFRCRGAGLRLHFAPASPRFTSLRPALPHSLHFAPPTHYTARSPANQLSLFIPLEASLAKINNDLIVTKFNGHFSVPILPNSSAGFDMVDHSFALESFSSVRFYDNTFWFPSSQGVTFQSICFSSPPPAATTMNLTNS